MNYLTITTPYPQGRFQHSREEQFKDFYRLPKYIDDPQLVDLSAITSNVFLGQTTENQLIQAYYRPIYLNNNLVIESDILIGNDNCIQPPKLLCQVCHPGIPVYASFSASRLLAIVFMARRGKKIYYQLLVLFPQQFSHKFDCYRSSFRTMHLFEPETQPIAAHILVGEQAFLYSTQKQFKIERNEVGKQSEASDRVLVMVANESVQEYQVQYTYYDVNTEFKNVQNKEVLANMNKFHSLALRNIQSFGIISTVKLVGKVCDCESLQSRICFCSYNCHQTDLVVLTRETDNGKKGQIYCKLYLYKLVGIVEKQLSIKLLQTFVTTYLPLEKYQFYYFDGLDLAPNAVRVYYHSLSAMNNVLTFEYMDYKEGKICLIACHLYLGSIIKLSMPNSMFLKTKHINPCFDENELTELVVYFLTATGKIRSEEQPEYTDMYHVLFVKSVLTKVQPYVICFADCFVWIIPNYSTNRMSICLIKALPYTPMEKILDIDIPLTQQHLIQRIHDFISEKEGQFYENELNKTMYDIPLNSAPNKEIAFTIKGDVLTAAESTQDYIGLPSESYITDFDITNISNTIEADDSLFQSLVDETFETSGMSLTSPTSSTIVSEQFKKRSRLVLFKDKNSVPLFSQQEASTYLIMNFVFYDKQLIFSQNNYLFYKRRFQNITQPCNNIFYYIEFFKAIKQDALETHEYLNSPYSEISLFAVNQILFTHKLFDTTDLTVKYISLHPKYLLENCVYRVRKYDDVKIQGSFSYLLRFFTEMIQQIVQVYKMQLGEFMNIVRMIWGGDIYAIIQANQDNSSSSELTTLLFDHYVSQFEDKYSPTQIRLLPSTLLSIIFFASTIKRITLQQIDRAGDIQPLPFEQYMAEYIAYQQVYSRLSFGRRYPRIYKLCQQPAFMDWGSNFHPIAKQYCYNQYLVQVLFKYFLDNDAAFLYAINLSSEEKIKQLTQYFDSLVCYRIFDRNFNWIMQLIKRLTEVSNRKQYKEAFAEANYFSQGATVVKHLAKQRAFINRQLQNLVISYKLYGKLLASNSFTYQLTTIAELVETVQICYNYTDIINANENVALNNVLLFPYWLQNMVLTEFNDYDLATQSSFQYVELGDVGQQIPIVNENYALLYNRSRIIYPLEYQLFSNFTPLILKKRPERIVSTLGVDSSSKASTHMLVKWAVQECLKTENDIAQLMQEMSTFEQFTLLQRHELFASLLRGPSHIDELYQRLTDQLARPYSAGCNLMMRAGDSIDIIRLTLSPFAKQRVLSFYQRTEIFDFYRAGKAVNKDEYYQILSKQGYESMYKALGGVGLYLRDFDEKRKVGQFLKGQFDGKDFAQTVNQLIDDQWQ